MIAANSKPSSILEQETDSIQTQKDYHLAMRWSLDENSKLICQWVKVHN